MTKSSGQDAALRDHFAENVKSPLLRKEIKKFIRPHPEVSFPDTREEAIRCADEDEKSCGPRPRVASSHETSTSTKPSSLESAMNEMIKTLQGQQKAIEDLAANLKKLNTVSTNRGQNVQPPVSAATAQAWRRWWQVLSVRSPRTLCPKLHSKK